MKRGIALGVAVSLAFAAMVIGAFGVLLQSALSAHGPLSRYSSAAAVVSGTQKVSITTGSGDSKDSQSQPFDERDRVPIADIATLQAVPGVQQVVADISMPVILIPAAPATSSVAPAPVTLTGHGWDSSELIPTTLAAGTAPAGAHDVVLDQATAASLGAKPGSDVSLQVNGAPTTYQVSGVTATGTPGTAYFTEQQAETLSGYPTLADALVVLAKPGADVSTSELDKTVPGLVVSTGASRGDVESPAVAASVTNTIGVAASLGGIALLVALLVVTGLLELSVRERTRELAVMRAVGATPRQVRRVIVREMLKIAVPSALVGGAASLGLGALLHHVMLSGGMLPAGFALALGPIPVAAGALVTILSAVGSAWLSARRVSRIRPVQALGETAAEPTKLPRWRVITGMVFLVLGAAMLVLTFVAGGQTASATVGGLVVSLMWAVALLGPWIARAGIRVLGLPLRLASPVAGGLASLGARAAAVRMAAVITPIALALSFSATQLFAQSTGTHATTTQAVDGLRADQVLVSSGPGIPHSAYDTVRSVPGVTGVTEAKRTNVVMAVRQLGSPELLSLQAQGLAGDLTQTIDPQVTSGSLANLTGEDTVALSSTVANGAAIGSTHQLWLGDGTSVTLRVVAVYDRGLGFGDVLLPLDLVAAHATTPLDDYLLVNGHADLSSVTKQYADVTASDRADYGASLTKQASQQGLAGEIAVIAIAGFILIGLVTTLGVATASRRRELTLLRLVGATRSQMLRVLRLETALILGTGTLVGATVAGLTLVAFASSVTGLPMLSISPLTCVGILAAVAVPGAAAVMLPGRAILRRTSPRIE